MPQTDAFMSESDVEEIVCELFANNCLIIPDLVMNTPEVKTVGSMNVFKQIRSTEGAVHFFVISDLWIVCPLEYGSFPKDGKKIILLDRDRVDLHLHYMPQVILAIMVKQQQFIMALLHMTILFGIH
ncbi:MAG: hypothetical protein SFX18_19140 [Pirellulales bacterium]|nr:hypothetical protein [Pirellulales bacterium]